MHQCSRNLTTGKACSSLDPCMLQFTVVADLYTVAGLPLPRLVCPDTLLCNLVRSSDYKLHVKACAQVSSSETETVHPLYSSNESDCVPPFIPHLSGCIGVGTYSKVFSMVCIDKVDMAKPCIDKTEVAAKLQVHATEHDEPEDMMEIPMNDFEDEVAIQLYLSTFGIAPIVYNAWTCSFRSSLSHQKDVLHDIVIMTILDRTLEDTVLFNPLFTGVVEMVAQMHAANVFHGDLHTHNIMVDTEGNPFVIDFGRSKVMRGMSQDEKDWCRLHDLNNLYNTLPKESQLRHEVIKAASLISPTFTARGIPFKF